MQLDVVAGTVARQDDSSLLKVDQGFNQGLVEAGGGFLADDPGERASVQFEYLGVHVTVEDVPADSEQDLHSNESQCVWSGVPGGMCQLKLHIAGYGRPFFGSGGTGRLGLSTWMEFLMAYVAKRG